MVHIYIFLISLVYSFYSFGIGERAVIMVPIADAVTQPLGNTSKYARLPCSPSDSEHHEQRAYQFIFNELVTITNKQNNEVECAIDTVFYHDTHKKPVNTFWTLEKNVRRLADLSHPLNAKAIPFFGKSSLVTLVLKAPWYDSATRCHYALGTRFVRVPQHDTPISCAVRINNYVANKMVITHISRDKALLDVDVPREPQNKIGLFVNLLKSWADHPDGHFPYVWGGCSGTETSVNYGGSYKPSPAPSEPYGLYSGFDCSSVILRAAQLCGIPYFYRNTSTLVHYLKPLEKSDQLQEGDLIWMPGHVMVVSDIQSNVLIQAAGYDSGYGTLHSLSLSQAFADISSYQELLTAYFDKRSLKRLKASGELYREAPLFLLLKLKSVWDSQGQSIF